MKTLLTIAIGFTLGVCFSIGYVRDRDVVSVCGTTFVSERILIQAIDVAEERAAERNPAKEPESLEDLMIGIQ